MTSNFEPHHKSTLNNSPEPMKSQGQSELNAFDGDRFELLSAYVDGEVTAAERKQVETWLDTDPTAQQLHDRLVKLRHAFRAMPAPAPSQPIERTVEQVLAKVDRRPNLKLIWGGGAAIAAAVVGALSIQFSRPAQVAVTPPAPTVAATTADSAGSSELNIKLDEPVMLAVQPATVKTPAKPGHDSTH
jgi:anti-sigma factor RsiW